MKYITRVIISIMVLATIFFGYSLWPKNNQHDRIIYDDKPFIVPEKIVYKLKWPQTLSIHLDYSDKGFLAISKMCVNFLFKKDRCRKTELEQPIPIQMRYKYNKLSIGDSYIIEFVNNEGDKSYDIDDDRSYYGSFKHNFLFLGEEEAECVYRMRTHDRRLLIETCVDPKFVIEE